MILMIDNFDSFTYNLVQYLMQLGREVRVVRNNALTLEDIREMKPDMIVLSPGPKTPKEAGICLSVVETLQDEFPILGICLGHQTIGQAFGGKILEGLEPVHGKVHSIRHNNTGVFSGLKNPINVTRYHSLVVDRESLPECLEITAETEAGEIMGLRHREKLIEGVQFHPEAILTEHGLDMLANFLRLADQWRKQVNV
ncbi:anthranilate synthase component II [Acidaminobacter hydrogenoformans]|uniref:Para-aminobenzoate synthetase component 2 n=1 Tax=Acidaminobacter hydrogenoformans DSM 2784 TaxID=1120920 RepID=A0A1G5RU75_9FIRM|nr:aminodeoxychorismate/anthranilate synthase component II [Acidaminobacter hydrogenoformans]SCZ77682.1 para-aminobenzoate synthetase component 2 [Acidaminobacter hydrogenoformans DSM 2784]